MSEVSMEKRLHATTDATVWAEEWCQVARGIDRNSALLDEGWMIGWFANAIETCDALRAGPLRVAMKKALNELGVPGPDYPAPVANVVALLRAALGDTDG